MHTPHFSDAPTLPMGLDDTNRDRVDLYELRDYPAIRQFINDNWGTLALKEYLEKLLSDTNGHKRQGFPTNVGTALLQISLANIDVLESQGFNFDDSHVSQFTQTGWALPKNF